MKILALSSLAVFCLSLLAPAAWADAPAPTAADKDARRDGMSHDEYTNYREKMRKRMDEQKPAAESPRRPAETDKTISTYGQGYDSRNPLEDSQEIRDKMAKLTPEEREAFRAELKLDMDKMTPEELMKIKADRVNGRADFLQQKFERFQMRMERRRMTERPARPLRPGR